MGREIRKDDKRLRTILGMETEDVCDGCTWTAGQFGE